MNDKPVSLATLGEFIATSGADLQRHASLYAATMAWRGDDLPEERVVWRAHYIDRQYAEAIEAAAFTREAERLMGSWKHTFGMTPSLECFRPDPILGHPALFIRDIAIRAQPHGTGLVAMRICPHCGEPRDYQPLREAMQVGDMLLNPTRCNCRTLPNIIKRALARISEWWHQE